MKRIQLTDGQPNDINLYQVSDETEGLVRQLSEVALKSELSYAEINKALYLTDKGLYLRAIHSKTKA